MQWRQLGRDVRCIVNKTGVTMQTTIHRNTSNKVLRGVLEVLGGVLVDLEGVLAIPIAFDDSFGLSIDQSPKHRRKFWPKPRLPKTGAAALYRAMLRPMACQNSSLELSPFRAIAGTNNRDECPPPSHCSKPLQQCPPEADSSAYVLRGLFFDLE